MNPEEKRINVILERYLNDTNIIIPKTDKTFLIDQYLSKVIQPEAFEGKTILEIGAGGSQYIQIFLEAGCERYYANDIIEARLAKNDASDSRYVQIGGNFLEIEVPEKVDFVFANLTMMMVTPLLPAFVEKIYEVLKPGGSFISMDTNYFCPLSLYRYFKDSQGLSIFSPKSYAKTFEKKGFLTEKLVPFTVNHPFTTGIWTLGTNFWFIGKKI
jgi:SAM-dependent methyltransferase